MTQSKNDFLILYGSQTGQAQAISEEIFDKAHKEGFSPRRFCLSMIEKKFSLIKENLVVFVCSTTGEGEPPDTASKFFRRLKKKTLANNHLEHLRFAFLALGDSNYTNFCACGKNIDARLLDLGAKHFYDTGYADDAVGLEIAVEPWIENLFPALRKHLNMSQTEVAEKGMNDTQQNEEKEVKEPVKAEDKQESSLYKSIDSLSSAALKIPSCPDSYLEIERLDADTEIKEAKPRHPSAETDVFEALVKSAKRLTNDPLVKKTLQLELDTLSNDFDFQPGDSFGIVCHNTNSDVDYLIQRLEISDADEQMTLKIKKETKKKAPTIPEHINIPSSIRKILTDDVDFRAVPRKF
ncbi:methionine synthase reductase-like [Clytia hemisphaerica]